MTKIQLPPVLRRWRFLAAVMGVTALAGGGVLLAASSDPATAMSFHPVTTTRLLDTRPATQVGSRSTPLGLGDTYDVVIPGLPTDATAVSINVTAVDGTEGSFLTLYPSTDVRPLASTINWTDAGAVANSATVNILADHSMRIFNLKGTVNVVVDLLGYYAPSPAGGGAQGIQGPPGPAGGPAAYLYASSTAPQGVLPDSPVAFDTAGPTVGGITADGPEDAFTVTNAGVYKVTFSVVTDRSSQLNVNVNGVDPVTGSMVFGADAGVTTPATTGGTAVLTLNAGDAISVMNVTSAGDVNLISGVGGSGPSTSAWIEIEQLS